MKVLLVNKFFYGKGGAESVFFQERAMLSEEEIDIVEFAMKHENNDASEFSDFFVDNVDYYRSSGFVAKFKTGIRFIYNKEACEKFHKLLCQEQPDIVHFHNIYHQLTPSIISVAKEFGCKTVLTAHDYKIACPNYTFYREGKVCTECMTGSVWNAFKNRCQEGSISKSLLLSLEASYQHWAKDYHKLDAVVAPSQFLANIIMKKLPKTRVETIVNGIDSSLTDNVPGNENYFVFFGRLSDEKGIPTLLKAHELMKNKANLKVVGTGPMEDVLKQQYKSAEFCGFQKGESLKEIILNARAVIVPSEWFENCSMSVLESMAYAKPVIGAEIGGIPEQIRDGIDGLLFPAGDVEILAEKMDYLFENQEVAKQMGESARERLLDKYSFSEHKDKLLSLYKDILVSSRGEK